MASPNLTDPVRKQASNPNERHLHATRTTEDVEAEMNAAQQSKIPEGTFGPHKTRLANALDPRVDSDLDSAANPKTAMTTGADNSKSTQRGAGKSASLGPTSNAPRSSGTRDSAI